MNNTNPDGKPAGVPSVQHLIQAHQIRDLPNFPEQNRQKYIDGVTTLWKKLEAAQEGSEDWMISYKKLLEVSVSIKNMLQKQKQAQTTVMQQNGARPASSGQEGPQGVQPQPQQPQQPQQSQPNRPPGVQQDQLQYSQKVMQKVQELKVVVPIQQQQQGPEATRRYVTEAKTKYAQTLHRYEVSSNKLTELQSAQKTRESQGRPLNPQEAESFRIQTAKLAHARKESRDFLEKFTNQQMSVKAQIQAQSQVQGANRGGVGNGQKDQVGGSQPPKQEGAGGPQLNTQPVQQEQQGQAHTVSSALDAARSQANQGGRSGMSPPNHGQPTHAPSSVAPNSQQISQGPPQPSVKPEVHPQFNSPHSAPSHPAPQGEAYPLSHEAAMQQARSYPHAPYPQHNTQSASQHGHPQSNQREPQPNNHSKLPIPPKLNIAPPQPVSMGPSRPTMTNGPLPAGPMGQPAIQKHPGYVLGGEGDHVLSKKKLEELVRQVTGGTGIDGVEGESLTPEVEEVSPTVLALSCTLTLATTLNPQQPTLTHPPTDPPHRRRRIRRPSHRLRLQARQAPPILPARNPRPAAHPRAQLQHPRPRFRERRAAHREEGAALGSLGAEAGGCPGCEGYGREGGVVMAHLLLRIDGRGGWGNGWFEPGCDFACVHALKAEFEQGMA